ncbi:SMP-30/gluconolactonase/LRE family protein [Kutzneria buriramensis]|uniref:SMP-30/gluconolactonase/LRE family protein n=1 Tax=Kutzneria buriramensis TaxID=1045776 RepID=UPI000E230EC7|nr:SMP-30/gluconolactonase/LRE family protein [Kutzneria buriramensis]
MRLVTTTRCQRRFGARRLRALVAVGIACALLAAGLEAELPVEIQPAVNAAAVHAFVAGDTGELQILDIAAGDVTAVVDTGGKVTGLAASPDGRTVYVVNGWTGSVAVVDVAQAKVVKRFQVKAELDSAVVRPDGKRLYVTGTAGGQGVVLGFDTATDTLAAVVQVGSVPTGIAVTPDGNHLYVTNNQSATVTVIDPRIATVTRTVPVDLLPQYVAISPDGATTYVTHTSQLSNTDGSVTVLDNKTDKVVARIPVGVGACALAVTADRLYVANLQDRTVSVVDTVTRRLVQTLVFPVYGIAVSNRDHSVYLATGHTTAVVDGGTGQLTSTIRITGEKQPATVVAVTG